MKLPEIRRYEMLVRVRDFANAHSDLFPASSLEGKAFAQVASAVETLSQEGASQVSGRGAAKEGSTSKAAARAALRETLDVISRTARALALDTTGLENQFRIPRGNSDQRLLNAARAFAKDAQPLSDAFVAHRMAATFLGDLNAEIDAFVQAGHDHVTGKEAQVAARAAIEAALETGLTAVQRLDAIVGNVLRDDPAAFAAWGIARHIERVPRGKTVVTTPPVAVPESTAGTNGASAAR